MSQRLFIWYSSAWGAAAAFTGWALGRTVHGDGSLTAEPLRGLWLGVMLALSLAVVDALAASEHGPELGARLALAAAVGAGGGYGRSLLGHWLLQVSEGRHRALQVIGWALAGLMIGAAPVAFDYLATLLRRTDQGTTRRKLRNGLIGGLIGGAVGGALVLVLSSAWAGAFKTASVHEPWSPGATGVVALGGCIGLAVSLAQVLLCPAPPSLVVPPAPVARQSSFPP